MRPELEVALFDRFRFLFFNSPREDDLCFYLTCVIACVF